MKRMQSPKGILAVLLSCLLFGLLSEVRSAEPATPAWQSGWTCTEGALVVPREGNLVLARGRPHRAVFTRAFAVDLDVTPVLSILCASASAQWRLTAQVSGGNEIVLADFQTAGTCRRNLTDRLRAIGRRDATLRIRVWGWGNGKDHAIALRDVRFVAFGEDCDAAKLEGHMLARHTALAHARDSYQVLHGAHPRLRFRAEDRALWRARAQAEWRPAVAVVLRSVEELAARMAMPTFEVNAETYRTDRPAWGHGLVRARPPRVPPLAFGEGAFPFPGLPVEGSWRTLCWHLFSNWLIGDAIGDTPVFREQAKRWVVGLVNWRFWLDPEFIYFDFGCAYPLQCLAMGYDIAAPIMTADERGACIAALVDMAHGLYLNTLSGHGSIYNDLRGNHTAVTLCGLGLAGLTLLDKHREAPRWVALADEFMTNAFDAHPSGAWLESPSYGAYGVNEWLKFAEMLENVCGVDRHGHPFLGKFGRYQVMISDWEGRDLGYNGGGAGQYWNHWVFDRIAARTGDREIQWLADALHRGTPEHTGYGDLFWWWNPKLEGKMPEDRNVGHHFADIGVSVWRNGWGKDSTIVLHHCGAKGQHKEQNMNHVTLYACGWRVLPDGVGGGTADHNLPIVGTREQNKWGPGETLAFFSDEIGGYALGDSSPATRHPHRRHVLYLRPDVLVWVDDIDVGGRRDVPVAFHLNVNGDVALAEGTFSSSNGRTALCGAIAEIGGRPLRLDVVPLKRARRATNRVIGRWEGRGRVRVATLIAIGKPANTLQFGIPPAGIDGAISFAVGGRSFCLGTGRREAPGEMVLGGELWLTEVGAGGTVVAALCVGSNAKPAVWRHKGRESRDAVCVTYSASCQ